MLSLLKIPHNVRGLRRYWNILRVLSSYGFDHALEVMGLSDMAVRGKQLFRPGKVEIERLSSPERLRLAMEELGPTFIKLGQILSTRPDIIPAPFIREFEKLQDAVPGIPYDELKLHIEGELGRGCEDVFARIDPQPLAAASIAQVHRAWLISGESVVIKVRRPGIVDLVESDISALFSLARLAERHIAGSDIYDPVGLVREFSRVIRREMDFTREGRTIEKFKVNFLSTPWMYFPKVYWEQSSKGLLTLEYVEGIKISDHTGLDSAGCDRKLLAKRGADAFLDMVLVHGYFHGDPHPGNLLILSDNIICLLDYGIVGRLDEGLRSFLGDLVMAIVNRDMDQVVSLLLYTGDVSESLDIWALKRDLGHFIDSYYEIPLQEIEVGRMLLEFMELITLYSIRIQPDLMLLAKSLVLIESMGRSLDPTFDMVDHLKPYLEREVRNKMSGRRVSSEIRTLFSSYSSLVRNLPGDLRELITRINRNKFKIDLEHRGLDKFTTDFDRSINRLSSSLILAALIIGSSIIMPLEKGPQLLGFPILALLGYVSAGLLGLWLVYAIIRSGRM